MTGNSIDMLILHFTFLFSLFVFVSAAGHYYILTDWVWGNSKFVVPETLTIDRGEAEVNRQCLGDNKLAIPSYPVNEYIIVTGCANKDKYSGTSVDIIKQQLCLFSLYYFSILILNRVHLILSLISSFDIRVISSFDTRVISSFDTRVISSFDTTVWETNFFRHSPKWRVDWNYYSPRWKRACHVWRVKFYFKLANK
jgi:hypothetical protein